MRHGPGVYRRVKAILVTCLLAAVSTCAWASIVTVYDFDSLADSESLSSQFAGLTIVGGTVLSAGVSLNEFDFPPHSGGNVVVDSGPTLEIVFSAPVVRVAGYFTYGATLSLRAFDDGGNLVDSVSSLFSSNWVSGGDPGSSPNEYLELSFAGIHRVEFGSVAQGFSFTLDDLTVEAATSQVPLPATPWLVVLGLALLGSSRRIAIHRR